MKSNSFQSIEYEIALLVRLTTAYSPQLGSLDRSEYLMLRQLSEKSPLGIQELAEQLMLNISTASRQVSAMEAKKYITRYPDPNNGRISLVQITEEGQRLLDKVQKARSDVYAEILQQWSPEELQHLEAGLSRLNRDFKRWRK